MKRLTLLGFVLCIGLFNNIPTVHGAVSFSTGMWTDMFTSTPSTKGVAYEVTVPLGLSWRYHQLTLILESAYCSANVKDDEETSEINSLTDTRLSASYAFPEWPIGLILGLDVNLPTGKATLSELERKAEIGENGDLFEVDDFGEGFNAGPSLGLLKEFGNISVGGNLGYLYRGEYNPSAEIPDDNYDPADQALVSTFLKWRPSTQTLLDGFVSYTWFNEDTIDGKIAFQEGQKFAFGGNLHVSYKLLNVVLRIQQVLQGKNKELGRDGTLITEPDNSNGKEFFGLVDLKYRYSPTFTLHSLGDIRYYGESERQDPARELPFEGKRVRYSVGLGFLYSLDEHLSLNALAKYFNMTKERDLHWELETTFRGVNLALGLTYVF